MTRVTGFVGLLLLASGADANAACLKQFVTMFPNQTVNTWMIVTSGDPCSFTLGDSPGAMHDTVVTQRPAHGAVTVQGHRVTYRSRPGYVGKDQFGYAHRGMSRSNTPITVGVRVAVDVRSSVTGGSRP